VCGEQVLFTSVQDPKPRGNQHPPNPGSLPENPTGLTQFPTRGEESFPAIAVLARFPNQAAVPRRLQAFGCLSVNVSGTAPFSQKNPQFIPTSWWTLSGQAGSLRYEKPLFTAPHGYGHAPGPLGRTIEVTRGRDPWYTILRGFWAGCAFPSRRFGVESSVKPGLFLPLLLCALAAGALDAGERAPVPPFEAEAWATPESAIDAEIAAVLRARGAAPAPPCSDEVFVRRVFLDVIGTLPEPAEVLAFLDDQRPGKRAALIETLLARGSSPIVGRSSGATCCGSRRSSRSICGPTRCRPISAGSGRRCARSGRWTVWPANSSPPAAATSASRRSTSSGRCRSGPPQGWPRRSR